MVGTSTVAGQGVPQGFAGGLVDILQPAASAPSPPPQHRHTHRQTYCVTLRSFTSSSQEISVLYRLRFNVCIKTLFVNTFLKH